MDASTQQQVQCLWCGKDADREVPLQKGSTKGARYVRLERRAPACLQCYTRLTQGDDA